MLSGHNRLMDSHYLCLMNFFLAYSETYVRRYLGDHGPVYAETDPHQLIMEPWNMVSAALFLLIVAWWVRRVWGQRQAQPLVWYSLPILAIGGIGGTIYHGFRSHDVWLVMDWLPIAILTLTAALYFWQQLLARPWLVGTIGVVSFIIVRGGIWLAAREAFALPQVYAITLGYSVMGLFMLIPIILVLRRTRWQHGGWVAAALGAFLLALSSRALDQDLASVLPQGTHFLWHTFGAVATHCMLGYIYAYRASRLAETSSIGQVEAGV